MGIFDRTVLVLYTLSLALISVLLVLLALGWYMPFDLLLDYNQDPTGRLVTGMIGLLFLVASLRLLYSAFGQRRAGQIILDTEMGEVKISLKAVENLVNKVGKQVKGIRDVKATVGGNEKQVKVTLYAWVQPESNVPEVTAELQDTIKRQVRNVIGVEVSQIRIYVEDVTNETRRS